MPTASKNSFTYTFVLAYLRRSRTGSRRCLLKRGDAVGLLRLKVAEVVGKVYRDRYV